MKMAISEGNINTNFVKTIKSIPEGENFLNCIQCGACSAICPSNQEGLNPFRAIRLASLGFIDELADDIAIWACCKCFLCSDVCPQNIQPAELINFLRGLAPPHSSPGSRHSGAIVQSIHRTGRIDELLVALRTLERDPRGILRIIRLGVELLAKRRLTSPIQRPIPNLHEIQRIYERLEV
ncbi:MAG: 4Fe-4S dicluster domain-containing protein [Candidatus Hodarchaeales archaeon]|jgi:heterodisulfide reductase subunit C